MADDALGADQEVQGEDPVQALVSPSGPAAPSDSRSHVGPLSASVSTVCAKNDVRPHVLQTTTRNRAIGSWGSRSGPNLPLADVDSTLRYKSAPPQLGHLETFMVPASQGVPVHRSD